jgi:cytochrome c peroxidase
MASVCAGCDGGPPVEPPPPEQEDELRTLAFEVDMAPFPIPAAVRPALVELGRALSFDPILSGNRDISCMTCHLPGEGTSDGVSLSIGQGGVGLARDRAHAEDRFIGRNSLPLFNLFALPNLFWDGRVELDGTTLKTPAGPLLTPAMLDVFEHGPISALGLFPVLSRAEMRGFDTTKNELAATDDTTAVWAALMQRVGAIPEYREMFEAAYPGTDFGDMTFAHASNAMGGFLIAELTFDDSPWDRFLRGDNDALAPDQREGAEVFMGPGRCFLCHRGTHLSLHQFHNTALAHIGPGSGHGPAGDEDFGRAGIVQDPLSLFKYAFRTPPLRNVTLTGPWGHAGQFADLRAFVNHYNEPERQLLEYDAAHVDPRLQATVRNGPELLESFSSRLAGLVLDERQVDVLTVFLFALTDPRAAALQGLAPARVPSGLPFDR